LGPQEQIGENSKENDLDEVSQVQTQAKKQGE